MSIVSSGSVWVCPTLTWANLQAFLSGCRRSALQQAILDRLLEATRLGFPTLTPTQRVEWLCDILAVLRPAWMRIRETQADERVCRSITWADLGWILQSEAHSPEHGRILLHLVETTRLSWRGLSYEERLTELGALITITEHPEDVPEWAGRSDNPDRSGTRDPQSREAPMT